MKIEILYFSGCPNHPPAIERVREVLSEERILADTIEVEVKDDITAKRLGFLGSPTIRIDDIDIEPSARTADAFGLTCRTYIYGGQRAGVPPAEWIRTAVREARGR